MWCPGSGELTASSIRMEMQLVCHTLSSAAASWWALMWHDLLLLLASSDLVSALSFQSPVSCSVPRSFLTWRKVIW